MKIVKSIMIGMIMAIGLAMPVFAASGGVEASDTVPAHNLVLRPIISPVGYSISYDLDGGTVATANPTSYNVESGDITLNNPTKEGYEFTGWTGSNGYSPSKSVTIQSGKTGNLSFTANWELKTYSITYNLDGGTATGNPATYNQFTDTFTLVNPIRSEYEFIGWTGSNGNTPQKTVTISQGSTGDLTYIANWEINYYILYWDEPLSQVGSYLSEYNGYIGDKYPDRDSCKTIGLGLADGTYAYVNPYVAGTYKIEASSGQCNFFMIAHKTNSTSIKLYKQSSETRYIDDFNESSVRTDNAVCYTSMNYSHMKNFYDYNNGHSINRGQKIKVTKRIDTSGKWELNFTVED